MRRKKILFGVADLYQARENVVEYNPTTIADHRLDESVWVKMKKDNESNEKDSTDKRTDYPNTGDLHHIGIRILLYDAEPCVHQQYRRIGDCTGELRPAVGIHDYHHHQRIPADHRFHHLRTGVRLQDRIYIAVDAGHHWCI